MIVVRDIFRLKFGQSKDATAHWKQAADLLRQSGYGAKGVRLLTDLAGPDNYTLILESTFDSLDQWEKAHQTARTNTAWRDVYQKIIPLTEVGRREILSIVA